jgi:hypothetical protein
MRRFGSPLSFFIKAFRAGVALLGKSAESAPKRIWSVPFDPVAVTGPANATCDRFGFFNFGGGGTTVRFTNFDVADFSLAGFGGAIRGVGMLGATVLNFVALGLVIVGDAGIGTILATGEGSFGRAATGRFWGSLTVTFGGFIFCGIILGFVVILVGARFAGDSFGAIICA